jgi:hypothetical protein
MTDVHPRNEDRARWAWTAVEAFGRLNGETYDLSNRDTFTEAVPDLIADLFHLCRIQDHDFVDILRHGLSHFAYEVAAEAHPDKDRAVDWACDARGDAADKRVNQLLDVIASDLRELRKGRPEGGRR